MSYICHYGVKGQKWGVRRYQNYDGTLTPQGRQHYYEMRQATFDTLTFKNKWWKGLQFVNTFSLFKVSAEDISVGRDFISFALHKKLI